MDLSPSQARSGQDPTARIALLGIGHVGRALLDRLAQSRDTAHLGVPRVVAAADSRASYAVSPLRPASGMPGATRRADRLERGAWTLCPLSADPLDAVARLRAHGDGPRIVVDATASAAVAARHARWLAEGLHVVTACKLGQGAGLRRWQAIRSAAARAGTCYGDSATVGAGLPVLRSLRALQAGGDRIIAVAGVLSGSLAWLFDRHDGTRPFAALVREARAAGYTEPDPRVDLSGEDLRRKLLILARVAGVPLRAGDVAVESLVPPGLRDRPPEAVDAGLAMLDAPLHARLEEARRAGARLCMVARLADGRARVGLEVLPPGDPLAGGAGTDNRVAIWSDRYRERPLVLQGPGAGAGVTAAALLDDVRAIQSASAGPAPGRALRGSTPRAPGPALRPTRRSRRSAAAG